MSELLDIITEAVKRDEKTKPYDTTGKVTRIDGGTVWVHIDGGVDETPVKMTIDAAVGDTVQVRVGGGTAFLVGNETAPPTDDKTAIEARLKSLEANMLAQMAYNSANEAMNMTTENAAAMAQAVISINSDISDLQDQIDGNITTWYYAYVPSLSNAPASLWTTDEERNNHIGDLFYNSSTGYAYRFMLDGSTYKWIRISDEDISTALANAATAQDTADHKRRVFITTPTPPYDKGDLWCVGSSGDILTCTTAKTSSQSYSSSDWSKLNKYTDDTRADQAYSLASSAKTSADGKNMIYRQASQPSGGTYVAGDIWFDSDDDNKIYRYNGSSWVAVTLGDDALSSLSANKITAGTIDASVITVSNLDAGNITTGNIMADRMKANSITAINSLTTGKIDAARLNVGQITVSSLSDGSSYSTTSQMNSAIGTAVDGIEVGGRNLLYQTPMSYTASGYLAYQLNLTENLVSGETYTLQMWGITLDSNSTGVRPFWGGGIPLSDLTMPTNGYYCHTFTVGTTTSTNAWINVYNVPRDHSGMNMSMTKWKLERGNKATDWTPAPEDVDSAINAVDTKANGANAEEQRIYYRTNSAGSLDKPSAWITNNTYTYNNGRSVGNSGWARVVTPIASSTTPTDKYLYLYSAVQRKTVDGTITCSDVLLDGTTTVIDGGNIVTGTVAANRIDAASGTFNTANIPNLDASKITTGTINIGRVPDGALNSNVNVGGKNLLRKPFTTNASVTQNGLTLTYNPDGQTYTITGTNTKTDAAWSFGTIYLNNYGINLYLSKNQDYTLTVYGNMPSTVYAQINGNNTSGDIHRWARQEGAGSSVFQLPSNANASLPATAVYIGVLATAGAVNCTFQVKLEKGNKSTDWTPAPEDVEYNGINLVPVSHMFDGSGRSVPTANRSYSKSTTARGFCLCHTSDILAPLVGTSVGDGEPITVSFDFKLDSGGDSSHTISFYPYQSNGVSIKDGRELTSSEKTSSWIRVKHRTYAHRFNDNGTYSIGSVYFYDGTGTNAFSVRNLKIERGHIPTEFTKAPEDFGATATDNITTIDSNGIWITPYSKKPTNVSTGAGATGTLINADGMEIYKGGNSVAFYGDTARVGKAAEGHVTISSSGMDIDATSSVSIGHLGYASGKNSSGGTSTAPYYTLGYRSTSNIIGNYSIAEGYNTSATSYCSHAEGYNTTASANYSHAEGYNSKASNTYAHAEGYGTTASGVDAHAEGGSTTASGDGAHAEGSFTTASGAFSHASGSSTIAQGFAQTAIGAYNVAQGTADSHASTDHVFIVGNGSGSRSNALALTWAGKLTIASTLTQNSDRRLKEHIAYLGDDAVDFINSLKPAHYIKDEEHHLGFYAQDVEEADKWGCMTGEMNGYLTLGYTELIAPLIAYCQRLEKRISELENER